MPYSNQSRNSAFPTLSIGIANLADGVDYNHLANDVNARLLRTKPASRLFSVACEHRRRLSATERKLGLMRIVLLKGIVAAIWLFLYRRLFCLT
jgi:hypothetical protein